MPAAMLEAVDGRFFAVEVVDRTVDGLLLASESDDIPGDCRVYVAGGTVEGAVVEVSRVASKRFRATFRFAERQFLDALRRIMPG